MSKPKTLDVAALIERQPIDRFTVTLLGLSMLVTFIDGYDLMLMAYAAPHVAAVFQLDERALGHLLTVGLAGNLLGALLTGWAGDRFGRRPALLWSTLAFGLLTLALGIVPSYTAFFALRFMQGVALGGTLPLLCMLNVEYAPRRRRATMVTLVSVGFGLGSTLAGPISVHLAALFEWRTAFAFGSLLSLTAFLLCYSLLPESLRYLIQARRSPAEIAKALRRFAPAAEAASRGATYLLSDESAPARPLPLRGIFVGRLQLITPLLWLGSLASSMAVFLLATWGPSLFEEIGFSRQGAAYMASANWLGGIVGGLVLMRWTDRFGPVAVAVMPALAVPVMLAAGLVALTPGVFVAASLWLAATLVGGHYGVISIVGLFYPSALRARGAGATTAVGRIGGLLGPQLGGLLMASQLPPHAAFAVLAVCPAILSACVALVVRAQRGGLVA
ncbi:MAG: MFS transporter [Steroidobacteraceae bacterium]